MWQLKFEYAHKDCLYSPHIKRLGLVMHGYPLNNILKEGNLHLTGLQILQGKPRQIQKYLAALKKTEHLRRLEKISPNAFFYQTCITANVKYYQSFYHPQIFYLAPIVHSRGRELFNIACWDRTLLESIMDNVKHNQNTRHFKLLLLRRMNARTLFLPQILPRLTERQRTVLALAKERGYWEYPKKVDLSQLAQELNISKSTIHEILKRGEAKLLDYSILCAEYGGAVASA